MEEKAGEIIYYQQQKDEYLINRYMVQVMSWTINGMMFYILIYVIFNRENSQQFLGLIFSLVFLFISIIFSIYNFSYFSRYQRFSLSNSGMIPYQKPKKYDGLYHVPWNNIKAIGYTTEQIERLFFLHEDPLIKGKYRQDVIPLDAKGIKWYHPNLIDDLMKYPELKNNIKQFDNYNKWLQYLNKNGIKNKDIIYTDDGLVKGMVAGV